MLMLPRRELSISLLNETVKAPMDVSAANCTHCY